MTEINRIIAEASKVSHACTLEDLANDTGLKVRIMITFAPADLRFYLRQVDKDKVLNTKIAWILAKVCLAIVGTV